MGDRSPDLVGAVNRSQADEPRPVPKPRLKEASSLDREARLADPAGTGECHKTRVLGELHEIGEFPVTADEGGQPIRQVAESLRRRPKGRKVVRQAGDVELAQALRPRHVLEYVPAEVAQARPLWQSVGDEDGSRLGQDDLATMPDGRHSSGPVDIEAAIVVARAMGLAGVEPDPHPDRDVLRPRFSRDLSLRFGGCLDGRDRLGEHREEGIALGSDGDPAVVGDCPTDQLEMTSVEIVPASAECSRERHRTLDVRAQESDRSGREVAAPSGGLGAHGWALIRSASVASMAMAASGRSRRIARRPSPPMTSVRTPPPSARTVAIRGRSRKTASSPMWSPSP